MNAETKALIERFALGAATANGGIAMALSVFEAALDAARQQGRDERIAELEWFGVVFRDDSLKHEREEAIDRLLATLPEVKS